MAAKSKRLREHNLAHNEALIPDLGPETSVVKLTPYQWEVSISLRRVNFYPSSLKMYDDMTGQTFTNMTLLQVENYLRNQL